MRRRLRRRYGHGLFSRRVDVMSTSRAQEVMSALRARGVSASRAERAIREHANELHSSVNPAHVATDLIVWEGLD